MPIINTSFSLFVCNVKHIHKNNIIEQRKLFAFEEWVRERERGRSKQKRVGT